MAPEKISEESSDSEKSIDLEMDSCCSSERALHDCRELSLSSSSSSPLSYTNDQDYQHHVLSLVNNNVISNRYHSGSGGNASTSNSKKEHVSCSSQCPCPSSASVSNYTSCSSSTATPEPEFPISNPNDGLREQEDGVKYNCNSFPKKIANINAMKGDIALVPRTVPCVVLSPPVVFSPTMYTSVSSPNILTMPLQLTKKQSFATRDLIEDKSDVQAKKVDSRQSDVMKPLAFGIDRILSDEKTTNVRKETTIYPMSVPEEDTSKSHRHHNHQHQHANYLNLSQCSECFYLSRYCRSVQFPVATPAAASASASYSWVTTPSVYDGSTLLSPTGYQHTSMTGSYSISGSTSFSAMPSMVSCNTAPGGRRKRSWSRAVFSNLQRKGLEKRFQIQKYITKPDRRQLAATLGLTDAQVKVWFQNRRMKWRHSKEGKNCGGVGEDLMTSVSTNNSTVALFSDKK